MTYLLVRATTVERLAELAGTTTTLDPYDLGLVVASPRREGIFYACTALFPPGPDDTDSRPHTVGFYATPEQWESFLPLDFMEYEKGHTS